MCTGTQSSPNIQDRVLYLLIMFVFKLSTEIYWVAEVHSRREEDSKIRRKPLKKECDLYSVMMNWLETEGMAYDKCNYVYALCT